MSQDQQVALTRTTREESMLLSKPARQIGPPFPQKLYEIVNDPQNKELIRWSDSGDSFFVINHERFAKDVLGWWFKHQKFSSFVRQLNMYGFHKIPHLQQGVLRSESDTEPWHFEHLHFRRDQPELLGLIKRKKSSAHGNAEDVPMEFVDTVNAPPAPVGTLPPGQVLDVNSIVNGIAAIKRHQQAISEELSTLKRSNDALWAEAEAARRRHDKHQDTINRILKFLAGVFGHSTENIHKDDGTHTPNAVAPRPRQRQRLMIADGRAKGKNVEVAESQDDEADHLTTPPHDSSTPFSMDRFATLEPTDPSVVSPSIAPSDVFSPAPTSADPSSLYPSRGSASAPSTNSIFEDGSGPSSHSAASTTPGMRHDSSLSPATLASLSSSSNSGTTDTAWQAAFQQMLNSPSQLQRLMQAFASQQNFPVAPPPDPTTAMQPEQSSQLTPYDPLQGDISRIRTDQPSSSSPSLPSITSVDDVEALNPLLDNSYRLQKNYHDASQIDADINQVQSQLESLIHHLGIDPLSIGSSSHDQEDLSHANSGETYNDPPAFLDLGGSSGEISSDVLDALFKEYSDGGEDPNIGYTDITGQYDPSTQIDGTPVANASTEQLTSFLDDVSDAASPLTHSPDLNPVNGRKRKSDVADLAQQLQNGETELSASGTKMKRKR